MRNISIVLAAVAGLSGPTMPTIASAMPMIDSGQSTDVESQPPLIENARTFCYNRYTGVFEHWGACDHHPRVYCRSNSTGRFLHWGACW